ncbi:MAG: tetratricopeptide repeat protein [Alphaproteobacteria bacterium]|nr:tetratricopeptide repeat protein [Alphaproteobacteria bacterium]
MESHPLQRASEAFRAGRLDEAAELCRAVLAREPFSPETNHLLGVIYFRQGKSVAARDFLARATASPAATAEMHNNFGAVLDAIGDTERAAAAFGAAIALQPGFAQAYNNLGVIHRNAGRTASAIESFRRALASAPDLAETRNNLRSAYRDVIPPWHFAMMDDARRNDAYEAAILRAVKGKRVLDIGTGAGLLAMLAAKGGAASVTTCESVGVIAYQAREIIAQNGFADRVKVVAKPSTELAVGKDMAAPAEVLVTEVFSSGLTNEDILPTLEHAHLHLLAKDAAIIPAAGAAVGYLAGGEVLRGMLFVDKVKGLDLSLFNDFAPPVLGIALDGFPHEIFSDDFDIIRFDFRAHNFSMETVAREVTVTRSGPCVGLAQWIKLELDAQSTYENRPSPNAGDNGHWTHILYRFPEVLQVKPGDVIRLNVRHDRTHISVDFVEHVRR